MATLNQDQARALINELIANYRKLERADLQSEANVRANFIDPLFAALNWPINDPVHYNREQFVRGAGFADIALKSDRVADTPLIFVEAKRFSSIELLNRVQDRRDRDVAQLRLKLPGMSVDRTREEQQAINYAYQNGMRWAVLTNFERLRLFNARRDTLVLSFDSPNELLERFDELWQLSFTEVQHGSLEGLRGHRERLDIDEEYLRLVNTWRMRLGQDILTHRENLILLEDPLTKKPDIYKLRDAVQRILDRLVVIRYAEDRLVIKADQLRTIVEIRERTDYGIPLLDQIRYFFQEFNVRHNGTLFAEHLCDRLTISEDVLQAVIINLYDARFRAMSADIMGNTYEQYLGQTLALKNGSVETVDNVETRKAQGSYYTPEFIVRYIVNQTLGRYLYGTENGRPDGVPIPGKKRKRLEDIDGSNGTPPLTILDPACGSGSFLMNTYHVLETFYEAEITRIQNERQERLSELSGQGLSPFDLELQLSSYKQRLDSLINYKNQILEKHLYGVDLDPQAAELAAVNLMLRAMTRGVRLPLILNQNIKVGDSLISGIQISDQQTKETTTTFATQLAELRHIRLTQQGIVQNNKHPIELQSQFERLANEVNTVFNAKLSAYFGDEWVGKRPFNWLVEFPEVFLNDDGSMQKNGGFTFIIGNPPYLSIDDTWGKNSPSAAYLGKAFADIWAGKSDVYYYFIRRALSLLSSRGNLGFITARYYLEAYYAQNLRQVVLQEATIKQIIDFGDYTVFPGVGTKTCITLLQRESDESVRRQNKLACDKVTHKGINIHEFLADFIRMAYLFPQASLDNDSWNLYGENVAQLLKKIDKNTQPLGRLTFIGKGMETGRNSVFVVDKETIDRYHIEPELIRKNIKNQDINRYNLAFRGLYLIYPEDVKDLDNYPRARAYLEQHRAVLEQRAAFQRGDCEWWRFTWPLHKELYTGPKIITPYIAPENRFGFDSHTEFFGLTDTTIIFAQEHSPDLRYLLALLNSKLLTFRYRYIGKAKDYRYEFFENGLKKLPIKLANEEVTQTLITLAQKMLDLNFLRQTLYDEFREMLQATTHSTRDFAGAYYEHDEYRSDSIYRAGAADALARGTVTRVEVREVQNQLKIAVTEETKGDLPLISLEVPDQVFRRFLLFAVRSYLIENERKQIWSRGRLLAGTLSAVEVPVMDERAATYNIDKIHRFMNELRQRLTKKTTLVPADRLKSLEDILDLSKMEFELQQTEKQIDDLVFQLYGITSSEDIEVIRQTLV